ncbi:hypothetical protein H0H81_002971, partial [Sphagnurus paluster]
FHDSKESGWEMIDRILQNVEEANHQTEKSLAIQDELVEIARILPDTSAGRTLRYTLRELLEIQQRAAARLKDEDASDLRAENERKLASTLQQLNDLGIPLEHRLRSWIRKIRLNKILEASQSNSRVWRNLVVAMKRLSTKANLYPRVFDLENVSGLDTDTLASGGFANIRKGRYNEQDVCIKTIRTYKGQTEKTAKDNILVDSSSRAYIADFGLSAVDDPTILQWATQSAAASMGGTPRYQSPELFTETDAHNTKASDVYAWSCVCHEIYTGKIPFQELTLMQYMFQVVNKNIKPEKPEMERGLTDKMWEIMENCLDMDPAKRPKIKDVLLRLELLQPQDDRPAKTWTGGPELRRQKQVGTTLPLTLEQLDRISSNEL